MQDSAYFGALKEQMDNGGRHALMQFLLDRDLSGIDLRRIPRTEALAEQQLLSLDSVGQWLHGYLETGGFEEPATGGGVDFYSWEKKSEIASVYGRYLHYCKRTSKAHPESISGFGKRVKDLLPGIHKSRLSTGGKRKHYFFPELDAARDEFVKVNRLASIKWAEDDELRLQQVS